MKKHIFRIFAVVAAAAMAFACSDVDSGMDAVSTHTVTFVSDYDDIDGEGTRTEIVENGTTVSYKWTADDASRLLITENDKLAIKKSVKFSEDYKTLTVEATFADTSSEEVTYRCSVAAERSSGSTSEDRNPKMLAKQTPTENSYDPKADILWAEPVTVANVNGVSVTNKFRFARVVSVNKITLKGLEPGDMLQSVELTADKYLTSYFRRSFTYDEKTATYKPNYTGIGKEIELDVDRTVGEDGMMSLYFTCAPAECTSFNVRVVTDKYIYEKALALSAEKTLKFTLDRRTGFAVNLEGCSKPNTSTVYKLVTSMEDFYPDATYIIVASKYDYALGQYNNGNNHPAEDIVKKTDEETGEKTVTITGEENVLPVIIGETDEFYTIQSTVTGNYLAATGGSSSNYLKQTSNLSDAGAKWNITIGENAIAAITANGVDRGSMRYNNSSKIFSCYGSTSDMDKLYLYVDPTTCHRTPRIFVSANEIAVNGLGSIFTPETVTVRTRYVEGGVTVSIPEDAGDWILDAEVENGELELLVDANYSGEERSAVLTLNAEGAEMSAEPVEITVRQEACVPKISIAEKDAVQYVGPDDADLYINVTSANLNEDIAVDVDADWLIADWKDEASKNKILNIAVDPLGKNAPRTATVTLSANGVSATVEVKQFKTVEFDYSKLYSANQTNPVNTAGPINVKFVSNGGTAPQYYTTGTAVRAYAKNTFTVSSPSADIARIEITFGDSDGSNEITTDVETYDNNGCWIGDSKSVKFTVGGTGGNRRIAKIKVFYVPGPKTKLPAPEVTAETVGLYVKLSWNAVAGADSYMYAIGDELGETTETSVECKMPAAGTYEWTVMASSSDSESYDDSDETTGSVEVTDELQKLATPEVEVTTNGLYVTLSWKAVPNADHYVYKVGDTERNTTATSVQVEMPAAGEYNWSVMAEPEDEDKYAASDAKTGTVTVEDEPVGEEVSVIFISIDDGGASFTKINDTKNTAVNGPITVIHEKGTSGNFGLYTPLRVYANNTLTFDGGTAKIVKIEFTATTAGYNTALTIVEGGGKCTNNTSTSTTNEWSGFSSKVVLRNAETGQARYSKIVVTYKLGEGGDTPVEPTKLATPVVSASSTATSVTLTWAAVDNADSYEYTIGDKTGTTAATTVTVDMAAGTYDWTVKAVSSDTANYTASDPATGSVTVTASTGGDTDPVNITLDFSSNIFGLRTTSGNDASSEITKTYDGYEFILKAANSCYWYQSKALFMGKANSYITFPAIAGYKLTSVTANNNTGASSNGAFVICDTSSTTAIAGGESSTIAAGGSKTWTLTNTAVNTAYRLYLTNAYNIQFTKIELVYTPE